MKIEEVVALARQRAKWFQHEGHHWGAMAKECNDIAEAYDRFTWKPIETAPTNSVDVLVCLNHGDGEILIARTPGNGVWWSMSMQPIIPSPTHWMPLPEPPK